jgi:hypothetical protein
MEAIAEGALIALLTVGLIAGTTFAARGGNGRGGGAHATSNDATLAANPAVVHSGDLFDVSGCGFDTSLGNVVVGFTGGSWGSRLDGAGCFTIAEIPALSGDVLPVGTYDVTAYQLLNGRWRAMASTTVTVVQ